ncbi:MAG: hypothetical protein QM572_08780 [Nocardioides sp.]|uniref:hypothetical protein n=1 Tax=Nocardioides sp. TaxID=35761 RepID=UPI0039E5288C
MRAMRFIGSVITSAAAVIALIGFTSPAQAGTGLLYSAVNADHDSTRGIYLRNGADMNNVTRDSAHYMTYGTRLELICGAWGTSVGPNNNRRWHYVRVASGPISNAQGWIADRYTDTPNAANQATPGEPECGAAPSTPPASTPSGTYLAASQQVRFCVNTSVAGCGTALGGMQNPTISQNTRVSMTCWVDGSNYTYGYATNRWFWVKAGSTEGFVSAAVVRNQTGVPACSSNKAVWAAQTAVQRYGETYARSADLALFGSTEWKPGPTGEWAGDCPKPPYVGWRASGVSIPKGNAIANYRSYANAGRINGGTPPVGAVAFFNVTSYGHETISLGNGLVLTTTGMDYSGTANTVKPYTSWSNYLGWAMPA